MMSCMTEKLFTKWKVVFIYWSWMIANLYNNLSFIRNESTTHTLHDVFAESLKNPDCVLIYVVENNRQRKRFIKLKILAKVILKVNWHYQKLTKQCHLFVKSLMHMNKKGKWKKNEELTGTVSKMNERNEDLESKIDFQEQY